MNDDSPSLHEQVQVLLTQAAGMELPQPRTCLALSKLYEKLDQPRDAARWAYAASDASDDLVDWMAAATVVRRCLPELPPLPRRARVAVLGSYTTSQFVALLPLAASRAGVAVELYECGYGQYRREVLDPASGLYAFGPDIVVFTVHAGELSLPDVSGDPSADVERELGRWTSLWDVVTDRLGARVVQHNFAIPAEVALGHLATRIAGSRRATSQRLNAMLGEVAGDDVSIVDCERLASQVGKRVWFDPRYWYRSKQAVSLSCIPLLARHTAAVIAAVLGQSRKCLVLDLDNTLWGGVLGEDGLSGIQLGNGAVGEAYSAFQAYVLELKAYGILLAVCSKNNVADAREVFEKHPDMKITLDDIAVFSARWQDKPSQLRNIAAVLGIGVDSLVFVDDNPAEREAVRQLVPEVDVVALPRDPAGYVRALSDYLLFESPALTSEDTTRTALYRARAQTAELQEGASSLDDFLGSLRMVGTVSRMDEVTVARVAQLIGKTNQFNLTGRRRTPPEVAALSTDPTCTVMCVRLRDHFADHGLVGVLIGFEHSDGTFSIDTWLMSCRVIGRTLEDEMLVIAAGEAVRRGCSGLRGDYIPSAKNAIVAGLYERLGFQREDQPPDAVQGSTSWYLPLDKLPASPGFITLAHQSDQSFVPGPQLRREGQP